VSLPRRWRRRLVLAVAGALLADQAVQWTVLRDGWLLSRRLAPFDPPLFCAEQVEARERLAALARGERPAGPPRNVRLDPELGWAPQPGSDAGDFRYDAAGARVGAAGPLPAARAPGVRRVVAVGCSFTHGDEVAGGQTWCSLVDAARADLELANLGVGGYGADQALLRLRRDGLPLGPDEAWFGLLPAAAPRVTTLYRPAERHQDPSTGFKPRFVPDGDGLRLVPCPAPSVEAALRLLTDQEAFAQACREDAWVARWPAAYAPRGSHPAHWFAAARLLLSRLEAGGRDGAESLRDPASETHRLLAALVLQLRDDARRAGAGFRLLLLPDRGALRAAAAGDPPWAGLVRRLRDAGVAVTDLVPALAATGALQDDRLWRPGGHWGPELHAVAARELAALAPQPP
jgi:hypothetical protein